MKEMASAGGRRWTRRQLMVSAIASALVGCSGGESDGATAAGTAAPDGAATTSGAPATEAGSTSAVATDATDATVPTTTTPATTTSTPPTTTVPAAGPYLPMADTWETVVPEEVGWSTEGLEALATTVGDARSSSFTVSSGGRLMVERYWRGATDTTATDVASVQKSVTSTLVGIAADRGLLGLDDAVSDHLGDGWSAAMAAVERRITLRHLMTHSSGLHPDTMRRAAAPGTTFDYNTFAYQKLRLVLEAASGLDINALSRAWLFDPIGLSGTAVWEEPPFTVEDAMRDGLGLPVERWTPTNRQRVGKALARLGCTKTRPRAEGARRVWCWERADRPDRAESALGEG